MPSTYFTVHICAWRNRTCLGKPRKRPSNNSQSNSPAQPSQSWICVKIPERQNKQKTTLTTLICSKPCSCFSETVHYSAVNNNKAIVWPCPWKWTIIYRSKIVSSITNSARLVQLVRKMSTCNFSSTHFIGKKHCCGQGLTSTHVIGLLKSQFVQAVLTSDHDILWPRFLCTWISMVNQKTDTEGL